MFQSGQIRVEASTSGEVVGLSDLSTLDGFAVVVDTDATGPGGGGLVSMLLTSGGGVDFFLDPSYAGYDFMSLADISLSGSGDISYVVSGPQDLYTYTADPLTLSATLSAQDLDGVVGDISGLAIESTSTGEGFLAVGAALFIYGVTIGTVTFDGHDPLVLKADAMFIGEEASAGSTAGFIGQGVIPEPDSARLMGVGVLIVGLAGASRFRSAA